jgi:hypothetical protein
MPEEFMVNTALLEATRTASVLIAEDQVRKELKDSNTHGVIEGTPAPVVPVVSYTTAAR